ncbi:MAG TPA: hypothetical protein PKW80_03085 [Bacteroidales bacterium]|nr:hypothetical protein [Bacteroidales bacterium]
MNISKYLLRPVVLKTMCILSFISGGAGVLFFGACVLLSGRISGFFRDQDLNDEAIPINLFITVSVIFFLLFATSVTGAFLMFKKKRSGFYIYLFPNSLIMIVTIIIVYYTLSFLWILYLLAGILFIILYAQQYSQME